MAKFVPILGNVVGSIGAVTWSYNRGGTYCKRRSFPTNPNSTRQQQIRAILSDLSRAWQTLSDTNKQSWNDWANTHPYKDSLGNSINWTGMNAYLSLNCIVRDFGSAAIATPPVADNPPALSVFTVSRTNDTTVSIAFTPSPLGSGRRIQLWQTIPTAGDSNANFNQARMVGYSGGNATTPATFTLTRPHPVGATATYYGVVVNSDGQTSPPLKFKLTP